MNQLESHKEEILFGRSIDDYLLYDGFLLSDKNLYDLEDRYIVEIGVPGFRIEELELSVEKETMILKGFTIEKQRKFWWTTVTKSALFQRSLLMPHNVAANTISAIYEPGVVQVVCPKQLVPYHGGRHFLVQNRKIKLVESKKEQKKFRWRNLFKKKSRD